jgi:hypothetical protein
MNAENVFIGWNANWWNSNFPRFSRIAPIFYFSQMKYGESILVLRLNFFLPKEHDLSKKQNSDCHVPL